MVLWLIAIGVWLLDAVIIGALFTGALRGPQGPQGFVGPKGEKGEPPEWLV
ncbi:hypothetical protein TRIXIE_63 [Mycobacterium phage Trixie]|uniref:Uncharacterized protein n=1 Tax=Mycobacterium phage Trixie TaxID=1071503 RepID=G1JV21_9CAUD|nr:hypothetical protein TRIXIE_63 [Mycobacterium phage Trixie]AEL17897.1 hypothetical protein TRIXIE_63 [Mycobacterium phage Trixie]